MALSKDQKKKYAALLENLGKRPRAVLEKILENGSVSTYELGQLGYDQPPRAAQDLKEAGVRLKASFGRHPNTGSRMAIYSLAESEEQALEALSGRRAFPSKFRAEVTEAHSSRCNLCYSEYSAKSLSLDHRIPFIVGGEPDTLQVADFQTLCGSHQRKKSWECEHCPNREKRDLEVCRSCFWAFPEAYTHMATLPIRQLDLNFVGSSETKTFDRFRKVCLKLGTGYVETLKKLIAEFVKKNQ